jgi:hypothetical protein
MPRLTSAQIESAIVKYQEGLSLVEVGRLFCVSDVAIRGLLKRRGVACRTLSASHRKLECNHDYFNEPLDEARAYWIGFILADGTVLEKVYGRSAQVAVALADKDRGHLEKLKAALQSDHKIVTTNKAGDFIGARLSISSAELVESLGRFGIVPRKNTEQVFSDKIPVDLLCHYFRGYFDGNGGISRSISSKWTINNVSSEMFLSRFLDWIDSHIGGHRPSIGFSGGIHRVSWSGTHRCKEILDLLYSGATVYLDRKKTLYDAVCHDASASPRSAYNRRVPIATPDRQR